MIKDNKLDEDLLATAAKELHSSPHQDIRGAARVLLPLPPTRDGRPLPALSRLIEMKGDAKRGIKVFKNVCSTCHQINNEGTNFGPPLTQVGSKLPREAFFTSILFPSAAIEHNYQGQVIKLKNSDQVVGIIVSDTDAELTLRQAGGIVTAYKKAEIVSRRQQKESIMPEDLQKSMTAQELVDLVDYLGTLRK
jgi:putative heme-binding domain-containing protein